MAVIAQADPYQTLIRKIGYSVGLEKLLERVEKFVALYVRERAIPSSAFKELVERDFGRRNAVEHFANFYAQLNLLRVTSRQRATGQGAGGATPKAIEPLYQADSLSVLFRLLSADQRRFEMAARAVLLQSIIEADGDIFLNVLATTGDPDRLRMHLETMIQAKRQALSRVMPGMLAKVYQIVDIKNESGGERSKEDQAKGRFGKRTAPLDSARRKTALTPVTENVVQIPDDYLSKAANSRKSWAEDLGLLRSGVLTRPGERLLEGLTRCCTERSASDPQAILFWGYKSDLDRMRLQASSICAKEFEAWTLLTAIHRTYVDQAHNDAAWSADELISFLQEVFGLYKVGNTKGIIRNSLPLYVAEPVLVGWCAAKGRGLPDLHEILAAEYLKPVRRVQQMIIRGTSGALFFMK